MRQGCVLSTDLFNIYSEIIMRDLVELDGNSLGGKTITSIRYPDDTVLISDSAEKLQNLVGALAHSSELRGLKLNPSKTKVIVLIKGKENIRVNIAVGEDSMEQIGKYEYLGSIVTQDGRCVEEIRTRISRAKKQIKAMVTNRTISINMRKRYIKAYVWSTLTYGGEASTIN